MGIRKVNAARFNEAVCAYCVEVLGGRVDEAFADRIGEPRVLINTAAGTLRVWPATHDYRGKRYGLFTVFCRFEDADRARELFSAKLGQQLNPYSGKYNFHEDGSDEHVAMIIESFKRHLAEVL